MIRTPLRPLARILDARARGENPDAIEKENTRLRHEEMRDKARARAEGRLLVLGVMFFCAFALVIGARMGLMASSEPDRAAGKSQYRGRNHHAAGGYRGSRGRVLATNFETHSLYAHPQQMIEPLRRRKGGL